MHKAMNLITVFVAVISVSACAKTEAPPADTAMTGAAMAPEMAPPMAQPMTEANVAGTWTGTSMPIGSDSVIAKWTQVCAAGSCTGTSEGSNLKVKSTYTFAGDSSIGVTEAYSEPSIKGGKVIDTWVVRVSGDNVTGTGAMKLASKPDSVVMRYRFSGSRTR